MIMGSSKADFKSLHRHQDQLKSEETLHGVSLMDTWNIRVFSCGMSIHPSVYIQYVLTLSKGTDTIHTVTDWQMLNDEKTRCLIYLKQYWICEYIKPKTNTENENMKWNYILVVGGFVLRFVPAPGKKQRFLMKT